MRLSLKAVPAVFVLMFCACFSVRAADPALNADQFKAPASSDSSSKTGAATSGLPVGTPVNKTVNAAGITGLQSDALLSAYNAAPVIVEPTPAGTDKYVCPKGYRCIATNTNAAGGSYSPEHGSYIDLSCKKERALYDQNQRGVCYFRSPVGSGEYPLGNTAGLPPWKPGVNRQEVEPAQ